MSYSMWNVTNTNQTFSRKLRRSHYIRYILPRRQINMKVAIIYIFHHVILGTYYHVDKLIWRIFLLISYKQNWTQLQEKLIYFLIFLSIVSNDHKGEIHSKPLYLWKNIASTCDSFVYITWTDFKLRTIQRTIQFKK